MNERGYKYWYENSLWLEKEGFAADLRTIQGELMAIRSLIMGISTDDETEQTGAASLLETISNKVWDLSKGRLSHESL